MLPGTHDVLGAKLAQAAGFEALVSGGYSASATLLGAPDISQLSYSEMVDYYDRLCDATTLPVLADADTGYGGTANVARTVRGYERAGVAAILLEDQAFPKRCGHFSGKEVVPRQEYVGKLKAALDARNDANLVIVARTDALAPQGIDEAIERMHLAHEAGADMLFIDALESREQMIRFCEETHGLRLANVIEGGRSPEFSGAELASIGFSGALYAIAPTYAVAYALRELYAVLRRDGSTMAIRDRMTTFDDFNQIVGLSTLREYETQLANSVAEIVGRSTLTRRN